MTLELTCIDCGDVVPCRRRTAKFCPRCRLRRELSFIESGKGGYRVARRCQTCSRPFRMTNQKDWRHCGHCKQAMSPAVEQVAWAACVYCGGKVSPRSFVKNLCLGCQSDPAFRKRILGGLTARWGERRNQPDNVTRLEALADGAPRITAPISTGQEAPLTHV